MLVLSVLLSSLTASAQDINCNDLRRDIAKANPTQVGDMFVTIATNCEPSAAARSVSQLSRAIPNEGGRAAAVEAVKLGYGTIATEWIGGLQPDDRAKAIRGLGEACTDSEKVQDFFISSASTMGDDFWNDRWYRALGVCNAVPIHDLLWGELDKGIGTDRTRFFGVLEAYARSAGAAAVPQLVELAKRNAQDAEAQVNIVNAFADAAQVGSVKGMDQGTAQRATRAIVALAPDLKIKAVEQARITLTALGSELESDQLAAVRYKKLEQADGFVWGAVLNETASCKGGKKVMQRLHWSRAVDDDGSIWPDQALEAIQSAAEVAWTTDLAARCRGEGTLDYRVSDKPFATDDELKAWVDEQIEELTNPDAKKVIKMDQDDLSL